MEFKESKQVTDLLDSYPQEARGKLNQLRALILQIAKETEGVDRLEETTKWGEPSYLTKTGSTIRMDWKEKHRDRYCLYFTCSTELVPTFRFIFGDELQFEGNRAIVLDLNQPIPTQPLAKCIELALTYHTRKHLPMLGV
ncbi:MAG: DUF1801 domain-containing protein [Bacteroidota bacterium]